MIQGGTDLLWGVAGGDQDLDLGVEGPQRRNEFLRPHLRHHGIGENKGDVRMRTIDRQGLNAVTGGEDTIPKVCKKGLPKLANRRVVFYQ